MLNAVYLSKLKERVPLLTVVRRHLKSEKVGILFNCPFCGRRNCNMIVNDRQNIFSCTLCSKQGDVFSFLHNLFGLSMEASLEHLSDISAEEYLKEIPDTLSEIAKRGGWEFYGEPGRSA